MKKIMFLAVTSLLFGCVNAANYSSELHSEQDRKLTAGVVQREIRNGMDGGQVAAALGSPNIVTKDEIGQETWIYDKIATEASYSRGSGSVGGLAGVGASPGSVLLLGLLTGDYNKQAGASASTQRTLTVVIKFDQRGLVQSATYHQSSF